MRSSTFQRRVGRREGKGVVKVNGDIFEAYVAAVVLSKPKGAKLGTANADSFADPFGGDAPGFAVAEKWLTELWRLSGKLKNVTKVDDEKSKGDLQRKLGGKGVLITYEQERERIVLKDKGLEQYFMGVYLTGWGYQNQHLGSGEGLSKKAAGMAAARDALERSAKLIAEVEAKKEVAKQEEEVNRDNSSRNV